MYRAALIAAVALALAWLSAAAEYSPQLMYPTPIRSIKVGDGSINEYSMASAVRTGLASPEPVAAFPRPVYRPAAEPSIRGYIRRVGAVDPLGSRASFTIPEVSEARVIAEAAKNVPAPPYIPSIPGTIYSSPAIRALPTLDEMVGMGGDNLKVTPQGYGKDPIGEKLPEHDGPLVQKKLGKQVQQQEIAMFPSFLEVGSSASMSSGLSSSEELAADIERLASRRHRVRVEAPLAAGIDLEGDLTRLRALTSSAPQHTAASPQETLGMVATTRNGGIKMVKSLSPRAAKLAGHRAHGTLLEAGASAGAKGELDLSMNLDANAAADSDADMDIDADADADADVDIEAEATEGISLKHFKAPRLPKAVAPRANLALTSRPRMVSKLNKRAAVTIESMEETANAAEDSIDIAAEAEAAAEGEGESLLQASSKASVSVEAKAEAESETQAEAEAETQAEAGATAEADITNQIAERIANEAAARTMETAANAAEAAARSELDSMAEAVAKATMKRQEMAARAKAEAAAKKAAADAALARKAAADATKPWWETETGRARNAANRATHAVKAAADAAPMTAADRENASMHSSLLATQTSLKSLSQWDPPSAPSAAESGPAASFLDIYGSNAARAADAYGAVPNLSAGGAPTAPSSGALEGPQSSQEMDRAAVEHTLASLLESRGSASDDFSRVELPAFASVDESTTAGAAAGAAAAQAAAAQAEAEASSGSMASMREYLTNALKQAVGAPTSVDVGKAGSITPDGGMPQLSRLSPLALLSGTPPSKPVGYHAYPWTDPNTAHADRDGKGITQLKTQRPANPYSFTVADVLYPHLRGTPGVSAMPSDAASPTPLGADGQVGSPENARAVAAGKTGHSSPFNRLAAATAAASAAAAPRQGAAQSLGGGNTIVINVAPAQAPPSAVAMAQGRAQQQPRAMPTAAPAQPGALSSGIDALPNEYNPNPYGNYAALPLNNINPPPSNLLHGGAPTPGGELNDHNSFGSLKV